MRHWMTAIVSLAAGGILGLWETGREAAAHCDTMDGPVVVEARVALEKGDVTPVLKWVRPEQEAEVRKAFRRAVAVRGEGAEAKDLADLYFFETLVRLHRAAENAPYTGLKPAGEVEAPIAAADQALANGDVEALSRGLRQAVERGVKERFEKLLEARRRKDESVEAGRRYVEAYVVFVHYVEGVHHAVHAADAHGSEGGTHVH